MEPPEPLVRVSSAGQRRQDSRRLVSPFVRATSQENAAPSHWLTAQDPDAGVFAITLVCLSYVTAAAGLVLGTSDAPTVEVVEFITDWFGRFNERSGSRYREHAATLYPLFRHGLAHQRHPALLETGDGRTVGWGLGRKTDRDRHVVLAHGPMIETNTGRRVSYMLSVQADLLFKDSARVFDAIEHAALADDGLASRISTGAWEAKTRTLQRRAAKVLLPRIRAGLDALDLAVPRVPMTDSEDRAAVGAALRPLGSFRAPGCGRASHRPCPSAAAPRARRARVCYACRNGARKREETEGLLSDLSPPKIATGRLSAIVIEGVVMRPSEPAPGNGYFVVNFYESKPALVVPSVHTCLFVGHEVHDGQRLWIFCKPLDRRPPRRAPTQTTSSRRTA
jgi:hypothetical protein